MAVMTYREALNAALSEEMESENEEKRQKPLTRRSSNVVSLVLNEENLSDKSTERLPD